MRILATAAFLAALLVPAARAADKPPPLKFKLVSLDPRFDRLIDKDAKLEVLGENFTWVEGPVWMPGGYLLFSDIPNNRVVKWEEGKGTSDFLKPAGYSGDRTDLKEPGTNGLLVDAQGRLVMMQHGNRQVARREKDGKITALVSKYDGKRLNSPNDGCFSKAGDLYFTDPPYGLMVKGKGINPLRPDKDNFPGMELNYCGVYRLSKDGRLTLLTKEMTKPNGIALSPDEKTLYVAQSDPLKALWKSFPVKEDGTLGEGKVFADVTKLVGRRPGLPDGMKVDADGNVFATGPGGVFVFAPDGTHLGTIETGVPTGNCCWGDDGGTLYVCANTNITRIKTKTKGAGWKKE